MKFYFTFLQLNIGKCDFWEKVVITFWRGVINIGGNTVLPRVIEIIWKVDLGNFTLFTFFRKKIIVHKLTFHVKIVLTYHTFLPWSIGALSKSLSLAVNNKGVISCESLLALLVSITSLKLLDLLLDVWWCCMDW